MTDIFRKKLKMSEIAFKDISSYFSQARKDHLSTKQDKEQGMIRFPPVC